MTNAYTKELNKMQEKDGKTHEAPTMQKQTTCLYLNSHQLLEEFLPRDALLRLHVVRPSVCPSNTLSNDTIPDPLRPPLPQDWCSQPPLETSIATISGIGKGTNFKF